MIIWLYAIFGNESKLMPYFLRHYAPWCDRLTLFDNHSDDGTADLIRAYPNAIVKPYPAERATLESKRMAQFIMAQYPEARGKADYAIWVDCDEFLWSGVISIPELLRGYWALGIRAIKPIGYQMLSNEFPAADRPITSQVRYGIRDSLFDKMSIFDPTINVHFKPGRHLCDIEGGLMQYQSEIRLLHYRYLGAEYFKQRNAYNNTNLSEIERAAGRTYHVSPDYVSGKYSAAWYQEAMSYMSDVVSVNPVVV